MKLLKKKNYLAMIENSAKGENRMFGNLYAVTDGKETDILENGNLSCAIFCSVILYCHKMIGDLHTTVSGLEKDLLKNGWVEIELPRPGSVLIWDRVAYKDGSEHAHVGFYAGNDEAVSNSYEVGMPRRHHFTYNNTRKIEKIYWHNELND